MVSEVSKENSPVIYILTNPSFPEYVKIGYASDVNRRLSELNNKTATPFAFRIFATYEVTNERSDTFVHNIIDTLNAELRTRDILNGKERIREFFALDPEAAYLILDNIAQLTNTQDKLHRYVPSEKELQDEKQAEKIVKERKKIFSFSKCKIEPGSVITLKDHPDINAKVIDDRHVEYDGEVWLLSPLTQKLLNKDSVQGALYWTFDGRRLTEIREEIEEKEN